MTFSRSVLSFARGAIGSVVLASIALSFYFGMRWNELLLRATRVPPSFCQLRPAEFQTVEMKTSVCVSRATALQWKDNDRLLKMAIAASFGSLLIVGATQRESKQPERRSQSRLVPVGVVGCTVLLLFWGVWPATIAALLLISALLGKRLLSRRI
jgi:hypothetical protein